MECKRKYITVKEALHRYGIGRTMFYHLVKSGVFIIIKCGRKTLLDVELNDTRFAAQVTIAIKI